MDCEHFREAISARIDNEDPPIDEVALDRHLDGCPSCRSWQAAVQQLTRRTRVRPAEDVPDLAAPIVTAITASATRRRILVPAAGTTAAPLVIRLSLGLTAVAQLIAAVPALAGNDRGATIHIAHEQAAWGIALAAALAAAAWRPSRAAALVPFLVVFVACLSALTTTTSPPDGSPPASNCPTSWRASASPSSGSNPVHPRDWARPLARHRHTLVVASQPDRPLQRLLTARTPQRLHQSGRRPRTPEHDRHVFLPTSTTTIL
jgi:predicted anti-sigma-YlaC factor YlaD